MPRLCSLRPVCLLLMLACAANASAQGRAWNVRTDSARIEPVEQRREVIGEFVPIRNSRLAANAEGIVIEMLIDAGDMVVQHQIIARLDDTRVMIELERYRAEVTSAQATVSLREAELEKASRDVARLEQAQAQQGASVNEVDDARTAEQSARSHLAGAQADTQVAKQRLADAQDRLEDMTIRAPFAGSIIAKSTEVGEWIAEGDTIAQLISLDSIDAILDVPQQYLPLLTNGAVSIDLQIDALAEQRTALVKNVISIADNLARTFPVRVRLDNPGHKLRPGMSVVGLVPTGQTAAALTVHKDALLRDDAGTYVYMVMGDTAMPARVRPIHAIADRIVIESASVTDGTILVTEGNERLYPSAKVKITPRDLPDQAQGE